DPCLVHQWDTEECRERGMAFRGADTIGMLLGGVGAKAPAVLKHPAVEPVYLERAGRPPMSGLIVHGALLPARIAYGDVVEETVGSHFSDKAELAFGKLLGHRKAGASQVLFSPGAQGFLQNPVS